MAQKSDPVDSVKAMIHSDDLSDEDLMSSYVWLSKQTYSPEEILEYGQMIKEIAEKTGNTYFLIESNRLIGLAYRFLGDLATALQYLFKSAEYADESEEYLDLLAKVYGEISTCYTQNGDTENAMLYGSKTVEILRKTDKRERLALTLINVGYDYYLINNYDSAIACYDETEDLLEDLVLPIGEAYLTGNRALIWWKTGQNEKAKEGLITAIEMLEPLKDRYGQADFYNQLSAIAFEEGNELKAISYAKKGLALAEGDGLKEQARDAAHLLYLLNKAIDDYKSATHYLEKHTAYKDSIQNFETTQTLANLRTKFEVGQKQSEVDLLLEQSRSNRIIIITGGIVLFVSILFVLLFYVYSKSKTRLNKQLEQQKDSLMRSNRTKDKFFSIISHDIRGPVQAFNGVSRMIHFMVDNHQIEELRELAVQIDESADQLSNLLDNLLNWAIQQQGQISYVPEKISTREMITDLVGTFENMARAKKIRIIQKLEDGLFLWSDGNTTNTILRNLINNALKFTPEHGEIEIATRKESEMVKILVRDTGVGIPSEKLQGLFDFEAKKSTWGTKGEKGLGLGLQLVKEFIEMNKGRIAVSSDEGEGTTFVLSLPSFTVA